MLSKVFLFVIIIFQIFAFENPIRDPESADPYVLAASDGYYYYLFTTGGDIRLFRHNQLHLVGQGESRSVFSLGIVQSDIWAPEIHFVDRNYYIYASGRHPVYQQQQMFVLRANSADPFGSYSWAGWLAEDRSAIDETVFQKDGRWYILWSQFQEEGQCIYIAPLDNPTQIGWPRQKLSCPEYQWERNGWPVNEGPTVLQRDGKTYIAYSASGCSTEWYSLGMLTNFDGNMLNPDSWKKSTNPVFTKSEEEKIYGVGHNCFVRTFGGQYWNVYHGMSRRDGGNSNRSTRLQPLNWHADGSPDLGIPIHFWDNPQ